MPQALSCSYDNSNWSIVFLPSVILSARMPLFLCLSYPFLLFIEAEKLAREVLSKSKSKKNWTQALFTCLGSERRINVLRKSALQFLVSESTFHDGEHLRDCLKPVSTRRLRCYRNNGFLWCVKIFITSFIWNQNPQKLDWCIKTLFVYEWMRTWGE